MLQDILSNYTIMKRLKSVCLFTLSTIALFFLFACSEKTEKDEAVEAADYVPKREPEATHEEIKSTITNGIADPQKSIDQSRKDLMADLEKQKTELISEFESSNRELIAQVVSLKSQYEKLGASLPKEAAEQLDEKISLIVSSLQSLQILVENFSPNSVDQIAEFKSEYEKAFAMAKDLVNQALKLLESKEISPPKLL